MSDFEYDFFVIGAGSGGVRTARTAAALGARTAVAEARFLGGTCVNVGCIPKKLYTYAAHIQSDLKDAASFGWTLDPGDFDWQTLKINKDREIKRLNGIYENLLSNAGVDIIEGRAELDGANAVRVGDRRITARHIVIATGGAPFMPPMPGIELAMNSDDFFELTVQPRRVVIVGGGFIATELAGVFRGLGSQVTLVHRGDLLLKGFDHDIREFYTDCARNEFDLRLQSEINAIRQDTHQAGLVLDLQDGATLSADAVLFATGRKPATHGLGLENAGVQLTDGGAVVVDEHFRTTADGVYAIGDVIDRVALTPVALAEGQLLANQLFGNQQQRQMRYDLIPAAVFTTPQIATVGLTEEQALSKLKSIKVFTSRFRPLKYTLSKREHFTFMKMLVDAETDRVVGVHMAGDDAAEIVQGMAVALLAGATKADFDATIGIHPTAAEEFVTMRTQTAIKG
jgi:glutathione reductase (NADPH)